MHICNRTMEEWLDHILQVKTLMLKLDTSAIKISYLNHSSSFFVTDK